MLKDKLAVVTALLTIITFVAVGYDNLATKKDLRRAVLSNSFRWAESNIKINNLQLDNLDKLKLERRLTASELRHYAAIESSIIRIVNAQEVLLNAKASLD